MTHLILCREYPPAPYPAGGIGTYARHIARQLAEAGETVHMIGQLWEGAPERVTTTCDGRLIVHRIPVEEPIAATPEDEAEQREILRQLAASSCPSQLFSWQVARYVEELLQREHIDVIEAQEWEAPLYYLLARRAAGLGPKQQPPCIVHLHSPTQMIFEYNEWDLTLTDFLPLVRFEEYAIRSADALLCPSRYLAAQVTERFGLEPGSVEVIPYAMGVETPVLPRSPEVWALDAICYVGRLELRKGVVEWIDAAVRVAQTHATVSFDFFGGDTYVGGGAGRSVLDLLRSRIPRALGPRFRFHGSRSRAELLDALANVAIAVVPSRWENFPFTCIEAMSTGLPVLASPHGGMAEMVVDGESGWIARDGSAGELEAALRRALATPAAERANMGAQAAQTIRRICNNESIVAKHLALRRRVAEFGTVRSLACSGVIKPAATTPRAGLGLVVTCLQDAANLPGCMQSIAAQHITAKVVVVADERLLQQLQASGVTLISVSNRSVDEARLLGLNALLAAEPNLRAIVFLDQNARLAPTFVEACDTVFARQPGVGLVAPWILRDGKRPDLDPGPCPPSLSQVAETSLPLCAAIRTEILLTTPSPTWKTLAEKNWDAFTYPGPLVSLVAPPGRRHPRPKRRYSGMALIQSQSAQFALRWFWSAPLAEKARWLGRIMRQPQRVGKWLAWQIRSRLRPATGGESR